jgi:hypothetical protein
MEFCLQMEMRKMHQKWLIDFSVGNDGNGRDWIGHFGGLGVLRDLKVLFASHVTCAISSPDFKALDSRWS